MTCVNQCCKITSQMARFTIKHQYLASSHKYFNVYSVSGIGGYSEVVNSPGLQGCTAEWGVMSKLAISVPCEKDSETGKA